MAKLPDRKMWDSRTKSFMTYPGIEPVQIELGLEYELVFVDAPTLGLGGQFRPFSPREFKTTGRRWTMWGQDGSRLCVWESEILEQIGRQLVVGMPWNYAKFNADHSDHKINRSAA
jgi:hypothetical protein